MPTFQAGGTSQTRFRGTRGNEGQKRKTGQAGMLHRVALIWRGSALSPIECCIWRLSPPSSRAPLPKKASRPKDRAEFFFLASRFVTQTYLSLSLYRFIINNLLYKHTCYHKNRDRKLVVTLSCCSISHIHSRIPCDCDVVYSIRSQPGDIKIDTKWVTHGVQTLSHIPTI